MSNCTMEPSVNNAVATLSNFSSDLVMVSYQCLTGFSLSGDQRIFCNHSEGVWPQAPRCHTIQSTINVSTNVTASSAIAEWFLYFLAIFLIILIILIILIALWCFFRPPCRQYAYYQEPVYYSKKEDQDDVFSLQTNRDSIFWVEKSDQPREAPVLRKPVPPAKDLVKEGKWMPHRNSTRNINTSTK
ncbi:hypothetical protein PoB_007179600 [Plakobranchus ocellatus]|uniref:Sushi domain-containing protein n=1 Tax=Plakobranchus ocellatus TaxID=259542 RepID=A0AAV4DMA0_9GAST|nr:hypothetical protein PoB_007179600 [Plakobranchus ocellatus]